MSCSRSFAIGFDQLSIVLTLFGSMKKVLVFGGSILHLLGREALHMDATVGDVPVRFVLAACDSLELDRVKRMIPEGEYDAVVFGHCSLLMNDPDFEESKLETRLSFFADTFSSVLLVASPGATGPFGVVDTDFFNETLKEFASMHPHVSFWYPGFIKDFVSFELTETIDHRQPTSEEKKKFRRRLTKLRVRRHRPAQPGYST